ncbi:MAG: methyltransferase domain-containing protein [Alphaproteobacteria bacterium]|nr:methyltransferase domain-containing protein [Alphaproteobacteria bacterium]MCW5742725.1 methyltransferase domain-containing protein [Alphaproteobacteria bacterium]
MDFAKFDQRHYPTLPVREGYGEWARTYEDTVLDLMDLRLLARLQTVDWRHVKHAVDLACGTGRIGVWLRRSGVARLHGVDFTEAMLDGARGKGVYDRLALADIAATGLDGGVYDLATMVLADEHLADLRPTYREAVRLLAAGGRFVLVGYHPFFLVQGIPTHFDRASGDSVAIESHVHLTSEHIGAGLGAGLRLVEMIEGVVDEDWVAAKPKWQRHLHRPISFALVWAKDQAAASVSTSRA